MRRKTLFVAFFVVIALGAGSSQKAVPKQPDKMAAALENVKQLLLSMEAKNGKISKEQWMKFMEVEFDKLDAEKKGVVDQRELRQSSYVKQARFSDLGR
jgi:hypothetical protein